MNKQREKKRSRSSLPCFVHTDFVEGCLLKALFCDSSALVDFDLQSIFAEVSSSSAWSFGRSALTLTSIIPVSNATNVHALVAEVHISLQMQILEISQVDTKTMQCSRVRHSSRRTELCSLKTHCHLCIHLQDGSGDIQCQTHVFTHWQSPLWRTIFVLISKSSFPSSGNDIRKSGQLLGEFSFLRWRLQVRSSPLIRANSMNLVGREPSHKGKSVRSVGKTIENGKCSGVTIKGLKSEFTARHRWSRWKFPRPRPESKLICFSHALQQRSLCRAWKCESPGG